MSGALIDLRQKTSIYGANTTLDVEDLEKWECDHGSFEDGTVLLVNFGWSKFWHNRSLYLGEDANGVMHFPGITMMINSTSKKDILFIICVYRNIRGSSKMDS